MRPVDGSGHIPPLSKRFQYTSSSARKIMAYVASFPAYFNIILLPPMRSFESQIMVGTHMSVRPMSLPGCSSRNSVTSPDSDHRVSCTCHTSRSHCSSIFAGTMRSEYTEHIATHLNSLMSYGKTCNHHSSYSRRLYEYIYIIREMCLE